MWKDLQVDFSVQGRTRGPVSKSVTSLPGRSDSLDPLGQVSVERTQTSSHNDYRVVPIVSPVFWGHSLYGLRRKLTVLLCHDGVVTSVMNFRRRILSHKQWVSLPRRCHDV